MITVMIFCFISGYILIALENKIGINKAAIALVLATTLWVMYVFSGTGIIVNADPGAFRNYISSDSTLASLPLAEQADKYAVNREVTDHLGDVAEIIFYLLGAMTIVEVIDLHKGFESITNHIKTRRKKLLLWITAFMTFFMSSVLDNLTTAIIMIVLLRKLIPVQKERWIFGSIVIIAANSGGAWTPIGDVTTIMLWINDNITAGKIMQSLFFPSLISLILPTWLISYSLKGKIIETAPQETGMISGGISYKSRLSILITGILCLLSVPVFKSLTGLPPFMGILLVLGIFWLYISVLYNRNTNIPSEEQFRIPKILTHIDLSTILFFLGILMSVAALESAGILKDLSMFLNDKIHNIYIISIIIGFMSSLIDNVPLVAATMGMYPVVSPGTASVTAYTASFLQNGTFWELTAYCAGIGGSILIIGSAAGVVVMGLEKINFIWYLKRVSLFAILGFLAGLGVYVLQTLIS